MKKNMRQEERKQRLALTLLFAAVFFCFFLITMALVSLGILWMTRRGILTPWEVWPETTHLILAVAVASILLGTVITFIVGRIPLRPVNRIINAMNCLADGNFKTRLTFGKALGRHPTFRELSRSFNTMAEELENTELLRSDFINNFSHEFKTPIVSIAGFAALLKRGNLTEEQRAEYAGVIEEESLRLAALATNVLNMTKVENQTILTDVTRYNLSEQIRSCVLLLERKWERKHIEMELAFDEYEICANEELLKLVWINLIDNAIKFSSEYSAVHIRISATEEYLTVEIKNAGNPIPAESMERFFHKFYQADESHASEGNGVGLAIVKKVVDLHQGNVWAESGSECTSFIVRLPRKTA